MDEACCSAGDTLILGDVVYGATEHVATNVLSRFGVRTVEVATQDLDAVERVLKANPRAKAMLFETPTNPTVTLTDIPALVKLVRAHCREMKNKSGLGTRWRRAPGSAAFRAHLHSG